MYLSLCCLPRRAVHNASDQSYPDNSCVNMVLKRREGEFAHTCDIKGHQLIHEVCLHASTCNHRRILRILPRVIASQIEEHNILVKIDKFSISSPH
ncbi:hypothetical protein KC19_5G153100 [Ceratodon purpureus]|uniref:Uncharacterized protein n=1 Tax=Ceratodon purpureus TaxID=3225 RepID=A0A8T0I1S2_CERPU|nr:hypothetical protein KC19_5G153100 [Ceratodon purpureus]KAG0577396.1 hypothetical protein KC19_5G153100 [Ceratodon purpureus]KAG0577397.1 hypothetical protein KC19_5G153100 [Ceratodon purpureus]